jgi:hypothetical protein
MPGLHQAPHHVAAHAAKANETDLHKSHPSGTPAEGHRPFMKIPLQPKLGATARISTQSKGRPRPLSKLGRKDGGGMARFGVLPEVQSPVTTTLWLSSSLGRSTGNWLPVTM